MSFHQKLFAQFRYLLMISLALVPLLASQGASAYGKNCYRSGNVVRCVSHISQRSVQRHVVTRRISVPHVVVRRHVVRNTVRVPYTVTHRQVIRKRSYVAHRVVRRHVVRRSYIVMVPRRVWRSHVVSRQYIVRRPVVRQYVTTHRSTAYRHVTRSHVVARRYVQHSTRILRQVVSRPIYRTRTLVKNYYVRPVVAKRQYVRSYVVRKVYTRRVVVGSRWVPGGTSYGSTRVRYGRTYRSGYGSSYYRSGSRSYRSYRQY